MTTIFCLIWPNYASTWGCSFAFSITHLVIYWSHSDWSEAYIFMLHCLPLRRTCAFDVQHFLRAYLIGPSWPCITRHSQYYGYVTEEPEMCSFLTLQANGWWTGWFPLKIKVIYVMLSCWSCPALIKVSLVSFNCSHFFSLIWCDSKFFLPHINYCCVIWCSAPSTTMQRLDILQKKALKIMEVSLDSRHGSHHAIFTCASSSLIENVFFQSDWSNFFFDKHDESSRDVTLRLQI